jgi:hypothetical protein
MTIYSQQDCIEALQEASEKLEESPTIEEYDDAEISPSASTLIEKFGSWNKA